MPVLTLLLIFLGPFLVILPGMLATALQAPEFWRPSCGQKPGPTWATSRPVRVRLAVAL